MSRTEFRVEGLRELEENLERISKAQGKSASRKAMKAALKPTLDLAKRLVPVNEGELKKSLRITDKLNKRQSKRNRKQRGDLQMFVGAHTPYAHLQEFGTKHHGAKPFMRPAWEATKNQVMDIVKVKLWENIQKQIQKNEARAASRAARRNGEN